MSVRRRFLVALGRGLYVTWPVLSAILVIEVALGLLIGLVEGWSVGEAVYFSFVTGPSAMAISCRGRRSRACSRP